ncbi:ABC transporter substrate-binding protein [Propylenella binzhouense]|uniref:ABC transporter substrate-binding protein n=1 Tax=Propylenella binzhouense TaxID=2555902 RepID=A0A964T2Y9_9HYPH|nr:ABC transporter substrate-binding protein [Propylenella binzhouense]MYZ47275.1 ABC transporter substrate-binding protein [Propylenella binzhouense]
MRANALRSVIAAAALLAAALAPAAAAPFRLIVTELDVPLVPNSVMPLAEKLGYFEREGVDVEIVRVQQTPSALAALKAGEGEMANVSVDAVLQLAARGDPGLKAVMSPNKSLPFLIAAKDSIARPAELAGRSFGIGRLGSLDHSLSAKVLAADGLAPDAVRFVALGQPAVRARALAAGQIDATTMSIGVWTDLPDKAGLHVLVDQDAYYAAAPVVNKVNVVAPAALESRRKDVEAVIAALVKASRDFAADPEKWVAAMAAERPDVSRATLETLAKSFAGSWSVNGGLARDELAATEAWLYETPDFAGLPEVPLAAWTEFGPLDAVLARLGTAPGRDRPVR